MRTDKKKVNLSTTSSKYMSHQQQAQKKQQAVQEKQQLRVEERDKPTRSSPILGTLVGLAGTAGTVASAIMGLPTAVSVIVGIAGCMGALMCRGTTDYDSIGARICAGVAFISAAAEFTSLSSFL